VTVASRASRAQGIVLRGRILGEADRIVTLLTRERGKLDAVAKGVRRPGSRLAGRLEFGCEVALGLHRGRNLETIVSADIVRAHWTEIVDPGAFATAQLCLELVDAFCEPDLAVPGVYALVTGFLDALGGALAPAALVPRFTLRLLGTLGYAPASDGCLHCGDPLADAAAWADVEAGGLACAACRPHRAGELPLERADVANFRALGAAAGGRERATARATPAAARAVDGFLRWHLGKRPRASQVFAELAHP